MFFFAIADLDDFYEDLYRRHHNALLNYAHSILKSRLLAEDAVQEVFLRIHSHLDRLKQEPENRRKGYLLVTTKHVCIDYLNRNRWEANIDDYAELISDGEDADPNWEYVNLEESKAIVKALLRELPEQDRVLLGYRSLYGLPYEEIARRTGLSLKNVSVRLTRLRRKLLTQYRERGEYGEQQQAR